VRELLSIFRATDWRAGSAEPWVADVLRSLVLANDTHVAIEIGGFQGFTSKRLARALAWLPHATSLTVCEIDAERAQLTDDAVCAALREIAATRVAFRVVLDDSLHWIPTLQNESVDFAWLDGNHEQEHVAREIELLVPKLAPGGLLCGHDVFGVCRLNEVFARWSNSFSLDLPRLGPAGGIGIIQAPR
jgi:predicted O-methyltransferase YrrM